MRLVNATGSALAAGLPQIRQAATSAGPLASFMPAASACVSTTISSSLPKICSQSSSRAASSATQRSHSRFIAEAAGEGGSKTFVVFDTTPNQCTTDAVKAIKVPGEGALLVTTGIGGDVLEEVDENGLGAFAAAFVEACTPDAALKETVTKVVDKIRELTDGEQQPMLIGEP